MATFTFNFDLNDYKDSIYKDEFLHIASELQYKGLIDDSDIRDYRIEEILDKLVKNAKNQAKFVKKLVKFAKQKRNGVKLASFIIQANDNKKTNGSEELIDVFYNGEFDEFVS